MSIETLLALSVEKKASDLHLSDGNIPMLRIDGELVGLNLPEFSGKLISDLLSNVMSDEQTKQFHENLELDFALAQPNGNRFRVNVFRDDKGTAAAFRVIPEKIFSVEELGLPDIVKKIANLPHGLVLVTGPTGSGKSTSLASIIHFINHTRHAHIITIEDPIEYTHKSINCLINQREVNRDTKSFNNALRSALREDPDVILIGELRDLDSVRLALTAAETGHLVFATLHTSSAAKSINRIIDIFPMGGEKNLIKTILSESLQAVVAQKLLKKEGGGRAAALEVLICNGAVRNLIRDEKIAQIYSCMQAGSSIGMQTLDQHLKKLVAQQIISGETAKEAANSKELFE